MAYCADMFNVFALFLAHPRSHPPHKVVLPSGCGGPLALRDPPEGGLLPTDPEAGSGGRTERAFPIHISMQVNPNGVK